MTISAISPLFGSGCPSTDCHVHARPRCSVQHDGAQPEGTWLLPPAIEGDPPQYVCESCGRALAAQGEAVQMGLLT